MTLGGVLLGALTVAMLTATSPAHAVPLGPLLRQRPVQHRQRVHRLLRRRVLLGVPVRCRLQLVKHRPDWQNRISSFQGYSGCRIRAFEFTSYGGSALGYTTASPNVGVLNDHIWSALFS